MHLTRAVGYLTHNSAMQPSSKNRGLASIARLVLVLAGNLATSGPPGFDFSRALSTVLSACDPHLLEFERCLI